MIWGAVAVSLVTLGVGLVLALALRALPTVRLQLIGLAALAVCLPLAAVLLSGWVMFHMGDDVKILAVSAASATVAMIGGLFLAQSIAGSIDRVRDASVALSHGDLTVRAPESGPAEVADLAESFNEMAANLEQLFDARRELVAWASHDLRTPLANMQAMLEALEDGLAEPADYLPALGDQVRGLSLLVDDLFELARIDAGALTLELHACGARRGRRELPPRRHGRGDAAAHLARLRRRPGRGRPVRARQGRARAAQPAHERVAPHARQTARSRCASRPTPTRSG